MSNPSKNIPAPISHIIRRWNEEMGSRSRRAPAFTGTPSLFLLREDGHAADRQGFNGQAAVLVKGVLLRRLEELLAVPRGVRVELKYALDKGVSIGCEMPGRTNLRDEANLQGMLRGDGIAEEDEGEGEARQCILAQVRHDGRRCETETHLGKSQGSVVSDVNEVTNDRKPEAEPEGVALDFRDADQGRSSQSALELDKTRCFFMDCDGIPACALAPRAEDLAARPEAQDSRTGPRCFRPQLGEHGVEHRAGHFIAVVSVVQCKSQDIVGPLDHHSFQGVGARGFDGFGGHGYTVYKRRRGCQPAARAARRAP